MNNKITGKHINYFPFIDGLRALAVLSVFIFHLDASFLPGGFVGVDVFFVISGFIVSASVAAFQGVNVFQFFAIFYSRRIKRIFPALIFMLLLVFLVSAIFIPGSWLSYVNQSTGFYAFFGFSNLILASTGRDYFAPTTDFNPFTHTWSLGVEEQFYLIFPFLYIFWLSSQRKYFSTIIYCIFGAVSAFISYNLSTNQPTLAYYQTIGRFWELASGVILYQLMTLWQNKIVSLNWVQILKKVVGIISLVGLLYSLALTSTKKFPMPGALFATLSTLGLFFSLYHENEKTLINKFLSNVFLRFVGKISFSLYLWHWPVFVFFRWTWGLDTLVTKLIAIVVATLLSLFSYFIIERPVRSSKFISSRNNLAVLFSGFLVVFFSYLIANQINLNSNKLSLSVLSKNSQDWYPEGSGIVNGFPGCHAEPEHLNVNGGLLLVYKPSGCKVKKEANPHSLFVIGDSHALAYAGIFKEYAIINNTTIYAYNNGGCPFLSFTPSRDIYLLNCRQYTDSSLKDMEKRIKPGDVLFFASLRLPRFVDQWAYFGDAEHKKILFSDYAIKGRRETIVYAKEILKPFVDKGVNIVFEAPKPLFKSPIFRCADWYEKGNPICKGGSDISRNLMEKYRAPILQSYEELGEKIPLSVWDPLPFLCGKEFCHAYKNGKPLFFDGDHLSGYGNKVLFPSFSHFMSAVFDPSINKSNQTIENMKIDFSKAAFPSDLENVAGLSQREGWGRWSDKKEAEIISLDFYKNLPKHFILSVKGHAFGPNAGKDITISYAGMKKVIQLGQGVSVQSLEFNNIKTTNRIEIIPPYPVSPKSLGLGDDNRLIGIGLVNIEILRLQ